MLSVIKRQFIQEYSRASAVKIAVGAFNFLPAAEMAIRAVGDAFLALRAVNLGERRTKWIDCRDNLFCALLYGFLGLNFINGSAICGAVMFTTYSIFAQQNDCYWTTRCIKLVYSF